MLKKYILTIGFFLFLQTLQAQNHHGYVWCPPEFEVEKMSDDLKGKEIKIFFFDSRHYDDHIQIECPPSELLKYFTLYLKQCFPGATFTFVSDRENLDGALNLTLFFQDYRAELKGAHWYVATKFTMHLTSELGMERFLIAHNKDVPGHHQTLEPKKWLWKSLEDSFREISQHISDNI